MVDLLFIIFASANLSLAFAGLYDDSLGCVADPTTNVHTNGTDTTPLPFSAMKVKPLCSRQRALAAFVFMALCGWVLTFTVSVFRLVERVSRSSER